MRYKHKHNKSNKIHWLTGLGVYGKTDQAIGECSCGYEETIVIWYNAPYYFGQDDRTCYWTDQAGNPLPFETIRKAAEYFLRAAYPNSGWLNND
jgi:hypothetical protein